MLSDPPRSHSPTAIWWWSGEPLRRDRLRWQLQRFAEGGVFNLVILNLAPSGPLYGSDADDPPFFSEPWWELLDGVCADAAELGVLLWFYDQLGFSGADLQARLVQRKPGFAGQWLGPSGEVTSRGFDYLSAEACGVLIDEVHGEFERRVGKWFGSVIAGSFQDELPSVPTWSSGFAAEFASRRGYSVDPRLLWGDGDPDVLLDYHRTRAELAEEAFFRPLSEWHGKHGLLHGCDQQDPARAGSPVEGVQLYADYVRTHRWFSAPGSDHHGDARLHSSLAHLYQRPRTWIEAFHSTGWGGTLEETYDWLLPWLRAGANLYNPHAVYYSTKAGWWEWAPPATDWRQPYWRHHKVFADAVTRLCAALSLGRHACDVAVLFPTDTVQSGTSLDAVSPDAARAQSVYRALVGDMAWFHTVPGELDRLGLDADVIDDDSLQRATISGGRLSVASESYRALVLPACTVLSAATCDRLEEFAAAGGLLVAVGALPRELRLRRLFEQGRARFVTTAADLGDVLVFNRRVSSDAPVLVREVGDTTVVFVTAAFPRASEVSVGAPDSRGVDLGWLDARYTFSPSRYAESVRIAVRDVPPHPVLVDPFTGSSRSLPAVVGSAGVEVVVPFDAGPAALVCFVADPPAATATAASATAASRMPTRRLLAGLGDEWSCELVPTLDNTWGDLARGPVATVERWEVEHRLDDAPDWGLAHATYGPHAVHRRGEDGPWLECEYSTSRGIRKDPVHRDTLGPKGHVPEEFLDLGDVAAGEPMTVRTRLTVPVAGFLVIGAPAACTVLVDGARLPMDDGGYLAVSRDRLPAGSVDLEIRLVPDEPVRLRAHVSVLRDGEDARRPEWLAVDGPSTLSTTVAEPSGSTLQVVSMAPCLVLVNGAEVGRQGGFDPYAEAEIPRVRRYDVSGLLASGANTVSLVTTGPVLTDGLVVTGPGWTADGAPARVRRRQHGDPAALHLWRRPHPLPGADWIDTYETALPAVLAVPDAVARDEWFGTDLPPGARSLEVSVHGRAMVFVDGMPRVAGTGSLSVDLPAGARRVEVRVRTSPGFASGAALAGPIRFECGPGRIWLGDWESYGLAGYSGGVRYTTTVEVGQVTQAVLDLGQVRGTAEVTVNGVPAGVRVCSPYTFDVTDALVAGDNEISVLVLGTLAPYLDAVSPTHFVFPGQRVTGLFGPVRLYGS